MAETVIKAVDRAGTPGPALARLEQRIAAKGIRKVALPGGACFRDLGAGSGPVEAGAAAAQTEMVFALLAPRFRAGDTRVAATASVSGDDRVPLRSWRPGEGWSAGRTGAGSHRHAWER